MYLCIYRVGGIGNASVSIKTCAPKGALAARQRVEEDPEALRICPAHRVARHMRNYPRMVMAKSDSIASLPVATAGDSHCRAPYPAPKLPASGSWRIRRTNRRNG